MLKQYHRAQKSQVSYLAMLTVSVLLAMVIGLAPILVTQIRLTSGKEDSTIAFSAADTGIERVLEAIDVGYDYYQFPDYGSCKCARTKPNCKEFDCCEEYRCDYSNCKPTIVNNDSANCGLPSKCDDSNDCICPTDKCMGYTYLDYPPKGTCSGGKCICKPTIYTNNSPRCKYNFNTSPVCTKNDNTTCPCPQDRCIGLELEAISSFPWKTPYYDNKFLSVDENGDGKIDGTASYSTSISAKNTIQAVGTYVTGTQTIKRAIELRRETGR